MPLQHGHRAPQWLAGASLAFAAAHLTYEHFTGGVQSHHVLDRPDLPEISNALGLIVLPVLGWLAGMRLRHHAVRPAAPPTPKGFATGFIAALLYGAALATAFELDAASAASALFFGLFLMAAAFPVYRAEIVLGFVVGMTVTFGAVLPTLIAGVFATVSVAVRAAFRGAVAVARWRGAARPRTEAGS